MTLHYSLRSPFSLDNSQEGKVLHVKEVGRILHRQDTLIAFRIRVKPLLVILVRFDKTNINTTYDVLNIP